MDETINVAPEAPAAAPAPEATQPTPAQPQTLAEARAAFTTPATPVVAEEPVAEEATPEQPSPEGAPVADEAPVESTGDEGPTTPVAGFENLPEGWTVKEVPEGHFYRDRGKTHIPIPPGWENEMSAFLNDPVRRADVSMAQKAASDARTESARWQATAEFYVNRSMELARNPEVALHVQQIQEAYGDDAAEVYLSGLFDKDQQALRTKLDETSRTLTMQEQERQADAVITGMQRTIMQVAPQTDPGRAQQLMQGFAAMLQAGLVSPTGKDFKAYLAQQGVTVAAQEQPAQQPVDVEALKAQIREELRQEAEAQITSHQQKLSTTPLAGARSVPAGGNQPVSTSSMPMTLSEARRAL